MNRSCQPLPHPGIVSIAVSTFEDVDGAQSADHPLEYDVNSWLLAVTLHCSHLAPILLWSCPGLFLVLLDAQSSCKGVGLFCTMLTFAMSPSETLAPFRSLAILELHPAHMATFIHYALVSHTCQEELVPEPCSLPPRCLLLTRNWCCQQLFYLNVGWFKGAPKAEDARVLFSDFLGPSAVWHT